MDFQYQTLSSFDRVPCLFLTAPLAPIRSIVVLAYSYTYTINDYNTKNPTCLLSFSKMLSMITLLLIATQATLLSPSRFLVSAAIFDAGEFITELLEGYETVLFFSAQTAGLCHTRDVLNTPCCRIKLAKSITQECHYSSAANNVSYGPCGYIYHVKVGIISAVQQLYSTE